MNCGNFFQNKNNIGNFNIEEIKEDGPNGKKGTSGTKCSLRKIEKLAVPAKVALVQSANVWVGDLLLSVHCMNNRHGGTNIYEDSGASTVGAHGKTITVSSIMDIFETWCNKFGEEQ